MAGTAAGAGVVAFTACGLPERELIIESPVALPEDLVRGEDAWYATTWGDGTGGDGLIVRVMQGRAKKIAGNPDFPVNLGKQSARYDTALQLLYHPDRIATPMLRRSKGGSLAPIPWAEAERRLADALDQSQGSLAVVTNPLRGHLGWVTQRFAASVSGRHIAFDPLEQGVLHAAVKQTLGQDRLPDFDIANAHTVLSFSADWLSTWVSPVGMSVKYGKFRAGEDHGYLVHVDSRMSMTAAAADRWLAVKPGWEGKVALAIGKVIVDEVLVSAGNITAYRAALPNGALEAIDIADVASSGLKGVSEVRLREAARHFAEETPSVAFGGGSAGAHTNGLFNLSVIFALNYLVGAVGAEGGVRLNPGGRLAGVPDSAHGASLDTWQKEIAQWRAGNVKTVIIRGADIVHGMPLSVDVRGALSKVQTIVQFATVLDDTSAVADLVLPEQSFLESWGTDVPEPAPGYQVVGFQQPVAAVALESDGTAVLSDARGFGDVLLWAAGGGLGFQTMQEVVKKASDDLFALSGPSDSINAPDKALFWTGVLQRGGWWDTKSAPAQNTAKATPPAAADPQFSSAPSDGRGHNFNLVPFVSNGILDGRLAASPWALASPDPMSSAVWVTWAEISLHDAAEMNVKEGDLLLIRSVAGEIEALAYPHPGVPPGIIGIPIGLGQTGNGRYASGRGSNVLSILVESKDSETGALAWAATEVSVVRKGVRTKLTKFEGTEVAYPTEPGVPILVVRLGQTAHEAQEEAHHEFLTKMTERANK